MKPCPLRKLSIAFGLIGAALMLASTLLLAFLSFGGLLYVSLGLVGGGALLVVLSLVFALVYKKKDKQATQNVLEHLDAIVHGDLSSRPMYRGSEEIMAVQKAVDRFPNATYNALSEIEETLEGEDFKKKLDVCLASIPTARSAIVLYGFTDRALPQSYGRLENYLRENYPSTLLGRVPGGYALYLPYATSASQIEGKVSAVISRFVLTENPAALEPVSLGLKAVISFYPDIAKEEIYEETLGALADASPIALLKNGEAHADPSSISGRAIVDMLPYQKYRRAMAEAKDTKARKKALRLLIATSGFASGYEAIGLAFYDPSRKEYRLIEELHREGMAPAFKALEKEGYIKEDRLDPYYKIALHERLFVANDGLHLPSRPAGIMDSLGLRSIAIRAVGSDEEKEGIIYLTSTKKMPECDYAKQLALSFFFDALTSHLLLEKGIYEREQAARREELLTTPFRHFTLELDPENLRVIHSSANLAAAFPELQIGKPCPTSIIPENVDVLSSDGFKRTLPALGPGMVHFQTISRIPTITLALTKQEQNLSSFRIDKGLFTLNRRALMADLEEEFLRDNEGIVLAFRIENADMIAARFESSTLDEVMAAILSRLSLSALEEGLYRYDDTTFAYLMSGGEKGDGRDLAVQIAEALSNPIPFYGKDFLPEISYYVISYPTEASCNFDLESLLRTSFARVAAVGKGRIVPFDEGEEAPLVLPRAYKEEALKKALSKGKFPLLFTPVVENASLRARYVKAGIGIVLAKGEAPAPEAVRALVHDEKTTSQLEVGEAQSFFEFYKAHGDILRASSIRGVILRISKSSMFSSTYIRTLSRGTKDAKLPKGYITLLVPNAFEEADKAKLEEFEQHVDELHVKVIYEVGENSKGNLLYLPHGLIEEATSSSIKAGELADDVAKAKEDRVNLILPSISKQEHRSYAIALGIPYGEGALYGENLDEERFLESIKE